MLLIPIWLWGLLWSLTLGFEVQPPQVHEGPPVPRWGLNCSGLKPAPVSTGKENSPEMCSVTHTRPVGDVGCADYLRWTLKEFRVVSCCVWHPAARVSIVLGGILAFQTCWFSLWHWALHHQNPVFTSHRHLSCPGKSYNSSHLSGLNGTGMTSANSED